MDKGIKFDYLVSEQETLALTIINSHNNFFINKLFTCNQDLKLSTFMACANNNFEALCILLQHDQDILHKFKDVEGCGFGVLQYAIASNNIALIDFVAKQDNTCFNEALIGYGSHFQMALTYNQPEVIKIIGQNSDLHQEILNLIKTNQVDMFDRAITHAEISQEEMLSILKSCIENDCFNMAETIIEKVEDVRQAFLDAALAGDLKLAEALISLKPEELTFEYVNGLMSNSQDENAASLFAQILSSNSNDETEEQLVGTNNYEIQIDQF